MTPPWRRPAQRLLFDEVRAEDERRAAVIRGPRQVGKTAILWQLANDLLDEGWPAANITYADFSDSRLSSDPRPSALDLMTLEPPGLDRAFPRVFLLDELGEDESWASWLKQAVDTTPHRFIASVSVARNSDTRNRESGQGRWDEVELWPLSFGEFLAVQAPSSGSESDPSELLKRFPNAPERYLNLGGYPAVAVEDSIVSAHRRLRSDLVELAVARQLRRAGVREVDKLTEMFADLVQNSGDIFTADKVRRALDVHHSTADEWLRLLTATMLVDSVPTFAHRPRAKVQRSKVYATDHGAVAAFLPGPDPLSDAKLRRRVAETAIYTHLRGLGQLRHFRSENGRLECSFVLEAAKNLTVVEITVSPRAHRKILQLNAVADELAAARRVLIYGGLHATREQGVELVPLHRFLLDPRSSVLPP